MLQKSNSNVMTIHEFNNSMFLQMLMYHWNTYLWFCIFAA